LFGYKEPERIGDRAPVDQERGLPDADDLVFQVDAVDLNRFGCAYFRTTTKSLAEQELSSSKRASEGVQNPGILFVRIDIPGVRDPSDV